MSSRACGALIAPLLHQVSPACPWSNAMESPWTKKNPFMSMWLSGANAAIGSARGRATAESRRQANAMVTEGTKQMIDLWASALSLLAKPKRSR